MWMSKLACLLDIFCHLNTNILAMKNKTGDFEKKLEVWDSFVQKRDVSDL